MTDEKRFDDKAVELTKIAAENILAECPELGSVMILLGWDMQPQVVEGLPAGAWIFKDGAIDVPRIQVAMRQLTTMLTRAAGLGGELLTQQQQQAPDTQAAKCPGA